MYILKFYNVEMNIAQIYTMSFYSWCFDCFLINKRLNLQNVIVMHGFKALFVRLALSNSFLSGLYLLITIIFLSQLDRFRFPYLKNETLAYPLPRDGGFMERLDNNYINLF